MHAIKSKGEKKQTENVVYFFNEICTMKTKEHIVFPPIQAPTERFIQSIGHETLKRVILHHHTLLRQLAVVNFYLKEYQTFMEEVTKIAHFMIEAFGCSKIFTLEYGSFLKNNTSLPFRIDEPSREIWLKLFAKALRDVKISHDVLAELWNWIELFSLRILNTATLTRLPKRYYYM